MNQTKALDINRADMAHRATQMARLTAQSWLETDAVIIDTETTGLDWGSEIVELCIIELRSGKVLLNTLVRPINAIPPEVTAIHGITDAMVADAPLFVEVAEQVRQLLQARLVIAYNVAFDKKMLCSAAAFSTGEPPYVGCEFVCAMLLYANFRAEFNLATGDFKWHSLVRAAVQQGITIEGTAHRAQYDCELTRELILTMAAE